MKIKEVIIVEGKDDITAVKRAVDAEVIATGGIKISNKKMENIKAICGRCGLIILTDPDYAGEKIRRKIAEHCPQAKHAFVSQYKAKKNGDIGIENASPNEIRQAIKESKAEFVVEQKIYSSMDLHNHGLSGGAGSKERREIFTDILGIGYANGKQLLSRLNSFRVTKEEFESAIAEMEERLDG